MTRLEARPIIDAMIMAHYADLPNDDLLVMINAAVAPVVLSASGLMHVAQRLGVRKSVSVRAILWRRAMDAARAERDANGLTAREGQQQKAQRAAWPAGLWFDDDPRCPDREGRLSIRAIPQYSQTGCAADLCAS